MAYFQRKGEPVAHTWLLFLVVQRSMVFRVIVYCDRVLEMVQGGLGFRCSNASVIWRKTMESTYELKASFASWVVFVPSESFFLRFLDSSWMYFVSHWLWKLFMYPYNTNRMATNTKAIESAELSIMIDEKWWFKMCSRTCETYFKLELDDRWWDESEWEFLKLPTAVNSVEGSAVKWGIWVEVVVVVCWSKEENKLNLSGLTLGDFDVGRGKSLTRIRRAVFI